MFSSFIVGIAALFADDPYGWIAGIFGGVVAIITAAGVLYGIIMKARQDKQKDAVVILQEHITLLAKQIETNITQLKEKDKFVEQLYELHSDCELERVEQYGWMQRAHDLLCRLSVDLEARGGPKMPMLDLPAKKDREKMATYVKDKSNFNSEMATATNSAMIAAMPPVTKGQP